MNSVKMRGEKAKSVVLVISNLGLGGAERQLVYLALGLRARGWRVAIASMTPVIALSFSEPLRDAGIPITVLQNGTNAQIGALLKVIGNFFRLVKQERPSALVGFMPHGALLARVIGKVLRVPRVVTSMRTTRVTQSWHAWVLAATRLLEDVSVANSHAAAKSQIQSGLVREKYVVTIRNGFDLRRISSTAATRASGASRGPFVWLNIAVFRSEKGHATLLEAVRRLSETKKFRLVLVGEGPKLEPMKERAASLGMAGFISFLGLRSEVADVIETADAFVLPSRWEGLPNALLEALAGSLPAVSTDVGGCSEILKSGVSGYLVPPDDPAALANAMRRIMEMPTEERVKMGAAGREHVLSGFSMDLMVEQWERVLSSSAPNAGQQF